MPTIRATTVAIMLMGLSAGSSLAATCNMTVQGAHVVDDQECTVVKSRGTTKIGVASYGTITVRGEAMSAQVSAAPSAYGRSRLYLVSLGRVVRSPDVEDKTCYFGQVAVLCIE